MIYHLHKLRHSVDRGTDGGMSLRVFLNVVFKVFQFPMRLPGLSGDLCAAADTQVCCLPRERWPFTLLWWPTGCATSTVPSTPSSTTSWVVSKLLSHLSPSRHHHVYSAMMWSLRTEVTCHCNVKILLHESSPIIITLASHNLHVQLVNIDINVTYHHHHHHVNIMCIFIGGR